VKLISRVKITVLAAVLLLGMVAIPAFAACPPGTIQIGLAAPGNYDTTVNGVGPGTYCIPANPAAGATPLNNVNSIIVNDNDVTIVGEVADATFTAGAAVADAIVINNQNCTLQNFQVRPDAGGAGGGIQVGAAAAQIVGVTLDDNAGANAFGTYGIQLAVGANDAVIENCTFIMGNSLGVAVSAIQLVGGSEVQIFDCEVDGQVAVGPLGQPAYFIDNQVATYNELQCWNNTVDACGAFLDDSAGPNAGSLTNSVVRDNYVGQCVDFGIHLGNNTTNTQILRNELTYGVIGGAVTGLADNGGSNIEYTDNRIIDGGNAGHALAFNSSNAVIKGNTLDATGADDGINAGANAANAEILNNEILGAGGDGLQITNPGNTNFTVRNNMFANITGLGIDNVIAAPANGGPNHTIEDNTFISITLQGIASNGNNFIRNNTFNTVGGVGIQAGLNDQITGNELTTVANDGINVPALQTNVLIQDNNLYSISNNGDGIDLNAGNCEVLGNTIDTVVGGGDGIVLNAGNQLISGNTILNVKTNGTGINLNGAGINNNDILDNEIDDVAQDGILVNASQNNTIEGNTIRNAAKQAVDAAGSRYGGIVVDDIAGAAAPTNNRIDGNTVENCGSSQYALGIDVRDTGGAGNIPANCDIVNNVVQGFTRVTGKSTTTAIGIRLQVGQNCTIEGNTVSNTGNLRVGIDITTPNETPVKDNTIEGMGNVGLRLRGGTPNNPLEVEGNVLNGNVTGLSLGGGASEITLCKVTGGATSLYVETTGNAATHEISNCCFTAPILANNEGAGKLDATGNYWGNTPQSGVNVFGDVDFSSPLASCPGGPPPGKSHTYGAAAGWYMVSVPLNSGSASSLFGTIAYRWNCATGVYDLVSMIEPQFGYWTSLPANKSVTDSGSQVTSDVTLAISCTGWHQVSAPWSYPKSAIKVIKGAQEKTWADAVTAGWVRDDIYAYSATGTDYTTPTTLNPWYGYWVRANVSGLSLKLLYASGTPVSAGFAPMGPKALMVPADLPPMPPSPSVGADDLEFGNYPNPIVDVHTTTFAVKGAMAYLVESLKVQIFDLAGRLVYEAEEAGTSLDWHTDSDYGEYLANGVYLYKLYALVNGEWVVSETKKLAILR